MDIIWLASYPKSGNTFLRLLLYRYIYADTIDTKKIEKIIPDLHKLLSNRKKLNLNLTGSVLAKTHFLFSDQHPYKKSTAGFIYIIRNPRDVLLSNARYLGFYQNRDSLQSFAETFIKNMGVPRWQSMKMGTYPEHFSSWLSSVNQFPHIFIKYEELRTYPDKVLADVIKFLGLELDQIRIQSVIEECEIDNLRKIEIQDKKNNYKSFFDYLPEGEYFIGQGKTNQSLVDISEEVEAFYQEKFSVFNRIFGY
jgi:hypothetical protein